MREHKLKIKEEYLDNLLRLSKKSIVVVNDKDYQKEDSVVLIDASCPTVLEHTFSITHIHSGEGLKENYVVLSLAYVKTE